MSNAEELAKYKKLLDDRVITQEDFDKKKEELLNRNESSGLTTDNTWLVTLLLCLFVGFLGIHRFYVGKSGTGFLQIITFGGLEMGKDYSEEQLNDILLDLYSTNFFSDIKFNIFL